MQSRIFLYFSLASALKDSRNINEQVANLEIENESLTKENAKLDSKVMFTRSFFIIFGKCKHSLANELFGL